MCACKYLSIIYWIYLLGLYLLLLINKYRPSECGVIQVEEEKVITKTEDPCKEKAAALAGEMQKALLSISGNLNHCTFNFNFS